MIKNLSCPLSSSFSIENHPIHRIQQRFFRISESHMKTEASYKQRPCNKPTMINLQKGFNSIWVFLKILIFKKRLIFEALPKILKGDKFWSPQGQPQSPPIPKWTTIFFPHCGSSNADAAFHNVEHGLEYQCISRGNAYAQLQTLLMIFVSSYCS